MALKHIFLVVCALLCNSRQGANAQRSSAGAVVGAVNSLETSAIRSIGRKVLQVDPSQRPGIPTGNNFATGSSNTANYFSSVPSFIRRIGAIGPSDSVAQAGSYSAADTTVIAGVRGTDNLASGSGLGFGSGSGTIGSNRGYSSAGRRNLLALRRLLQRSSVAAIQPTRAGTSTSLNGADRSAGTLQPAWLDTGSTGYGSGSSASTGLASGNAP